MKVYVLTMRIGNQFTVLGTYRTLMAANRAMRDFRDQNPGASFQVTTHEYEN